MKLGDTVNVKVGGYKALGTLVSITTVTRETWGNTTTHRTYGVFIGNRSFDFSEQYVSEGVWPYDEEPHVQSTL